MIRSSIEQTFPEWVAWTLALEVMEIEESSSNRLFQLFAESFPQFKFPQVLFEERTEVDGSISYNARLKLLGQTFTSGPLGSKEEASESVRSIAYEVIKEFKKLVLSETDSSLNCEALSSLFRPLQEEAQKVASSVTQEALRSVNEIKNRLIEVENEKINQKVKTKSEKIVEKMQGTTQIEKPEPMKISKIEVIQDEKTVVPPVSLSPLNIEEQPPKKSETKDKKTTIIGAPIPAFYEFVEKQSSKDTIVFEDFNKGYFFGSRLRWGKRFWVAPAEFKQKKDARNQAAIMACIECFGEGFTFEGFDPRIHHNWTRESVRQASDKYSFATSDELLGEESNFKVTESAIDPSKLKVEPLADGRKFTSVLNEICQKLRLTPPNYQIASVNTLTNYYVCTVRNFHDLPQIESIPYTKKNEAKEDAAGRIYYILKQKGKVDEASRIIGRMKAFELAAQSKAPISDPIRRGSSPPPPRTRHYSHDDKDHFRPAPLSDHFISAQGGDNSRYAPVGDNSRYAPVGDNSRYTAPVNNSVMPPSIPPPQMMNPLAVPPASMMPMMMMAQMAAQQQSGQPPNVNPFDPMMMQNFMEMSRQWQAFLAWQQQQQANPQNFGQPAPEAVPVNHYEYQEREYSPHLNHYDHHNSYSQGHSRREHRADSRHDHPRSRSPTDSQTQSSRRETDEEYYARKRSYENSRRRY